MLEKFCKKLKLKYVLVDSGKISIDNLKHLVDNGSIVWLERYKEKYEQYIKQA